MSSTPGRAPAVGFIFVTLVLAIVGFGLLIPVLPKLIAQFQGGDLTVRAFRQDHNPAAQVAAGPERG